MNKIQVFFQSFNHFYIVSLIILISFFFLCFAQLSQAATIVVNQDIVTGCTLIDAIKSANADTNNGNCMATGSYVPGGADTIVLQSDVTLTEIDNGAGNDTNGLPVIVGQITILGNDHIIQRSSTDDFRLFQVTGTGDLTLDKLTLSNGGGDINDGGAVFGNPGSNITVNNSTFTNNSAAMRGGAIHSFGDTLTISHTSIHNNNSLEGGGIYFEGSALNVNSSVVNDNKATAGAGLMLVSATSNSIVNSTISDNLATDSGGGIHSSSSQLIIRNSTISHNSAPQGGGVRTILGITNYDHTIVSNNMGGDCATSAGGMNISNDYNLSSDASCSFINTNDQEGTNPVLGDLQDNGGPTFTRAISIGSPALNTGGICSPIVEDQRGQPRPGAGSAFCDIGAYEFQAPVVPVSIKVDIIPLISSNPVFLCKGAGLIPVAILGSSKIKVSNINITTLQLGNSQLKLVGKTNKSLCAKTKINKDAFLDLVCIFKAKDTGVATSVNRLPLTGKLLNGSNISGSDKVRELNVKSLKNRMESFLVEKTAGFS